MNGEAITVPHSDDEPFGDGFCAEKEWWYIFDSISESLMLNSWTFLSRIKETNV